MLFPRITLIFSVITTVAISGQCWALDESRIWLPKKYKAVKPKLLAAARDAERTERCVDVLGGEMIVRKNTADHYYFVITCRDSRFKSYTLSYEFPVAGEAPTMVAEQVSRAEQKKQQAVEVEEAGLDADKALKICRNQLTKLTDELDGVSVIEQEISKPFPRNGGFFYRLPMTAKSDLGNDVRYRIECEVAEQGDVEARLVLESAGALTICRDEVRAETVLYGRIQFDDEAIEALPDLRGFYYKIPFDVKNRIGSVIRYQADCQLSAEGDAQIGLELLPSGAFTICKDSLLTETLLMKSVEVAEQPSKEKTIETELGRRFSMVIPFKANDPDGNQRDFKASCLVDEEDVAEVVTAIDTAAIVEVCIGELKRETKTMLNVQVLHQQIPELEGNDESGYLAVIPFDALNPSGRTLQYQAECKVGGNGRSTIKLSARK
ncbi:hypothetical protein [Oceanicoccus sp. KOV_DT_Chl]|uniref:hypothetical protein n=1 Tax=Oceanicoccus sp. KOV_DT_Chl TaxID=1904639 RepID=UPI000C7C254D|nr:hypothetical protein [Oceanicoccus sp. KOV_DT_Chl]